MLGILLMNIVGFGMHFAAYDDPTVQGGGTGINLGIWTLMHVLAEGKMRCLFSMLFGAGIVLLTGRSEGRGGSAADVYYRRNLWLLVFGVVHAYLLWAGEILYPYALCALTLYPFRKLEAKRLLAIAAVAMLLPSGYGVYQGWRLKETIATAQAAEAAEKRGSKLTEEQEAAKGEWAQIRKHAKPTAEELEKNNRRWRGSFVDSFKARAEIVMHWHWVPLYDLGMFDMWSMMVLGMALLKMGVLDGRLGMRWYVWMAVVGYGIGLTVNTYTAQVLIASQFDLVAHRMTSAGYDIGRLSVALAHVGVLMVMCRVGWLGWLTKSFAAIGQMALTNYLTHSVVCATLFCGYGFGLYGRLERYQLYYVVGGIWVFQMIFSPLWLRYYQFGPAEWGWRSLTYWKRQPMRRVA